MCRKWLYAGRYILAYGHIYVGYVYVMLNMKVLKHYVVWNINRTFRKLNRIRITVQNSYICDVICGIRSLLRKFRRVRNIHSNVSHFWDRGLCPPVLSRYGKQQDLCHTHVRIRYALPVFALWPSCLSCCFGSSYLPTNFSRLDPVRIG